jgi:hypothetical protein
MVGLTELESVTSCVSICQSWPILLILFAASSSLFGLFVFLRR